MTTFKIGQLVRRSDARLEHTPFKINSDYTLRQVEAEAKSYEVVKDVEQTFDFDLPAVTSSQPSAPKVHIGGDVCIACEG